MWRRVDLVWTDVLEVCIASIFRVEKSASEEPARADGCRLERADFSTLKMEAKRSSKTSVHIRSTRCDMPEDGFLHIHRSENLKSYKIGTDSWNFKWTPSDEKIWGGASVGTSVARPHLTQTYYHSDAFAEWYTSLCAQFEFPFLNTLINTVALSYICDGLGKFRGNFIKEARKSYPIHTD
jgi:hypothetical protein